MERSFARSLIPDGDFVEIFIRCPLEVCEARDPKGLYQKARNGLIKNFTGIDSPYEAPEKPEIALDSASLSTQDCADVIIKYLLTKGVIRPWII
jgi:adenylylsulfate kinase-like enzyme